MACWANRDVGNFVEEERSAISQFESAYAISAGIGKRALDVTEDLALECALGQAARVDGDQR